MYYELAETTIYRKWWTHGSWWQLPEDPRCPLEASVLFADIEGIRKHLHLPPNHGSALSSSRPSLCRPRSPRFCRPLAHEQLGTRAISVNKAQRHCAVRTSQTFTQHINLLCHYQLCQLNVIFRFLKPSTASTLVHAFVVSRLDYCSAFYHGHPACHIASLHRVLRTAAQLVGHIPKFGQVTAYMRDVLHWLPYSHRIAYRI